MGRLRAIVPALALLIGLPFSGAEAQRCPIRGLYYVVRDRDGTALNEAELQALIAQSPPPVGDDAGVFVGAVSVGADGSYWSAGNAAAGDGPIVPALHFRGVTDDCQLHLTEVTLSQGRRRMRLIFDLTL